MTTLPGRFAWLLPMLTAAFAAAILIVGEVAAQDTRARVREAQLRSQAEAAKRIASEITLRLDETRSLVASALAVDGAIVDALGRDDLPRLVNALIVLHRALPSEVQVVGAYDRSGYLVTGTVVSHEGGLGLTPLRRGEPTAIQVPIPIRLADRAREKMRQRILQTVLAGNKVELMLPIVGSDHAILGAIGASVGLDRFFWSTLFPLREIHGRSVRDRWRRSSRSPHEPPRDDRP